MPTEENDLTVGCATYTHARRHPMVIGQIGGWTPPFQFSISQIAVLVTVLFVEYQTWGLWLGHLPSMLAIGIAVVLPASLTWAVRRARFEGRGIHRAAMGWLNLALTPKAGRAGGRNHRWEKPVLCSGWVFVAPAPAAGRATGRSHPRRREGRGRGRP